MSKYYGLYKAVVESNNDKLKLNRLKVRINHIHSPKTPITSLPWAMPASPVLTDPPIPLGTIVYVAFEHGDENNPVYIGYMLKSAQNSQCHSCKWYKESYKCDSFPNGIPSDIYTNTFIHTIRWDSSNSHEKLYSKK